MTVGAVLLVMPSMGHWLPYYPTELSIVPWRHGEGVLAENEGSE